MKLFVPEESIERLGTLTLHATVNGEALLPAVYDAAGSHAYVRELAASAGELELLFHLDRALPPEEADSRERGIIVSSIRVE